MQRILITGATGNIGTVVIEQLCFAEGDADILAAVRDFDRSRKLLPEHARLPRYRANPFAWVLFF